MGVFKQKTSAGETKWYYYQFMIRGEIFKGRCIGCSTRRAAEEFEKKKHEEAQEGVKQQSKGDLIRLLKQKRFGGRQVMLDEAFNLYLRKPARRKRSEKQLFAKKGYWNDFTAFLRENSPEVIHIDEVTSSIAEDYIAHLKTNGRFVRQVSNGGKASYTAYSHLSNATINCYHKTLRSIFEKLADDAGLDENPFSFDLMENESESREAFSLDELRLISENMDDFIRPIFIIGIFTGLSEGDICMLKWADIQEDKWIVRQRRKTKVSLDIPILPHLRTFFVEQRGISGKQEYVLPEHAAMYLKNQTGISYRFKTFLEKLGINTSKKVEGRDRSISIKDVHALRHTFAYLAGVYNIPLPIVQSILGHMSPEMTKHYQAHADRKMKELYIKALANVLGENLAQPVVHDQEEILVQDNPIGLLEIPHVSMQNHPEYGELWTQFTRLLDEGDPLKIEKIKTFFLSI